MISYLQFHCWRPLPRICHFLGRRNLRIWPSIIANRGCTFYISCFSIWSIFCRCRIFLNIFKLIVNSHFFLYLLISYFNNFFWLKSFCLTFGQNVLRRFWRFKISRGLLWLLSIRLIKLIYIITIFWIDTSVENLLLFLR
jgi:hypothetical protein